MFSKLPVTQRPIIGCCNSMLRSKTCISTSIVEDMSNSPLTQFTNQQESKFSKSTLTMMKRVAKKTARRMSHKYSSSTFSGGCGTARNSKEFLSLDIARDSEYHNIWYIITYNCTIWYINIHLPHSMAGAELSTAGKSKEFLSLDIARDSESLKLDRFINLLFSVLVLSTLLLPILTNTEKQKKGRESEVNGAWTTHVSGAKPTPDLVSVYS